MLASIDVILTVLVFWVVMPCTVVGGQKFQSTVLPPFLGSGDGGDTFLWNVGRHLQDCHNSQDYSYCLQHHENLMFQ
jgi:hypothetical protein